jgi:hypothetical protein
MTTLREIRLFHWRQLMATRKLQRTNDEQMLKFPGHGELVQTAAKLKQLANDHLSAVQCLNDYCTGTAEQDESDGIPPNASFPPDDLRARAICGAGDLAELCARYAAYLERLPPQPGQTVEAGPETVRALHERSQRAQLVRELAVIFFRAAELERMRPCASPSVSG